jgi:hypothetical protein
VNLVELRSFSQTHETPMTRKFPAGCYISNIHKGTGVNGNVLYAQLNGPDGRLLISATLDYIQDELSRAEFVQEGNLKPIYSGNAEIFTYSNDLGVNNRFMRIGNSGFYNWYEWSDERDTWKCLSDELMCDKKDLEKELEKAYQSRKLV